MNYCYYCFSSLDGDTVCPHCGAPVKERESSERALSPGVLIRERYLVGQVMMEDPLGITYFGYDRQQNKQVWVREYLPEGLADRQDGDPAVLPLQGDANVIFHTGKDQLAQRAREIAQYNSHPGMSRLDCYFEENGSGYIVMDRLPGKSLSACLRERGGKLEWFEALQIMSPVIDFLRILHGDRAVHGYVSPDNVYVGTDGQGRLITFNILCDSQALPLLNARYLPKGLFEGNVSIGPWVDVYGMAASLYYMVTGEPPVAMTDPLSGQERMERPSRKGVTLPPRAEGVLMQVLNQAGGPWTRDMGGFEQGLLGSDKASYGIGKKRRKSKKANRQTQRPAISVDRPIAKKWFWLGPVLGVAAAFLVVLTLAGTRYFGAQGLYRDGMESLRLGRTGEAITSFQMAMERFPWANDKYEDMYHQTQAKDFAEQARDAMESGSYQTAVDMYEQAVEEDPANTEYKNELKGAEKFKEGYVLYEDDQFAQAKLSFESALAFFPSNSYISGLIAGIDAWSEGRDAYFSEDYETAFNAYSKALEYDTGNATYIFLCDQANSKWQAAGKLSEALYLLDIGEYMLAYDAIVEAAELDPDEGNYDELVDMIFKAAQIEYFYEVLQPREYTDTDYLSQSKITKGPDYMQSVDTLPYNSDCMCIYLDPHHKLTVDVQLYLLDGLTEDSRISIGRGLGEVIPSNGSWLYWDEDIYSPGIYCIELTLEDTSTVIAREYVRVMNEDETITVQ